MKFTTNNWLVYFIALFILFCVLFYLLMNFVFYPGLNTQKVSISQTIISGFAFSALMTFYKFKLRPKIDETNGKE